MSSVTIIGTGTMGRAIASVARDAGATVQTIGRETDARIKGDMVVLAVPYQAIEDVLASYGPQLEGRIVVDISNPRDPDTNEYLIPEGTSAAEMLAAKLPASRVVKAFNTTPAEHFLNAPPGERAITVLIAGNDRLAKLKIMRLTEVAGVEVLDDGPLSRARELEREGLVERTLEVAVDIDRQLGGALIP